MLEKELIAIANLAYDSLQDVYEGDEGGAMATFVVRELVGGYRPQKLKSVDTSVTQLDTAIANLSMEVNNLNEIIEMLSEARFILGADYGDVLTRYTNGKTKLKRQLLSRLRKEDLPLFINFEWEGSKSSFLQRLKG